MDQQLLIDGSEIPASTVNVPKISLGRWHLHVLDVLDTHGSLTDEEMISLLHKNGNTIRPRRLELARHCYIEKAGMAKTPSGRQAQRWQITDRGRKSLDQARLP